MNTGTFTIIVPICNEAAIISEIVRRVAAVRNDIRGDVSLLLVNDGSTDDSSSVLRDVCKESWISYTEFERHVGQHNALIAGFRVALNTLHSEIIGTMDADLDPGPEAFLQLLPHHKRHDLLIGSRVLRHRSIFRSVIASVLRFSTFCIRPNHIRDHGSMFRVYRSELVERILDYSPHGAFVAGLSLLCSRSPAEIPVISARPIVRTSRYSASRIARTGWQMMRLILRHPCGIGVNRNATSRSGMAALSI